MSSDELCMAVYVLKKKISDINFFTRDIRKMNETGKLLMLRNKLHCIFFNLDKGRRKDSRC